MPIFVGNKYRIRAIPATDTTITDGIRTTRGKLSVATLKKNAIAVPESRHISTQSFPTASFANLYSGSEQTISLDINRNEFNRILRMGIQMRFTVGTAAARLIPSPFWITRWELKERGGAGEVLGRSFSETDWINNSLQPDDYQKELARQGHYHSETMWHDGRKLVPVSGVVRAYLPLYASAFTVPQMDLSKINEPLQLTLTFPSNPLASSAGTPTYTVNDVSLVVEHLKYNFNGIDDAEAYKLRSMILSATYLLPDQMVQTATVTASTRFDFTMSALRNRKVAFLMVCLRSSTSHSNWASINAARLGAGATFNVVNASGNDLTGGPVTVESLNAIMCAEGLWNLARTGWYLIPFTQNMQAAFWDGDMSHGYWQSDSAENVLRITPGAAPTNVVHTTTMTNAANDGGSAAYQFGDSISPTLAFGVSAADAVTGIESTREYLEIYGRPTITASATPLAATSTLTFSAGGAPGEIDLLPKDIQLSSNNLSDGGVGEVVTASSYSTIGVPGFVSGTYTAHVYAYCFREVQQFNGNVKSTYL